MERPAPQPRESLPWLGALLVLLTLIPSTIVIPVIRSFVVQSWPDVGSWLPHAFLAANLLGACVGGPLLAVRADRLAARRSTGVALALLDGLMALLVAAAPAWPLMLLARFIQGAASVGAVSIFMGSIRSRSKSSGSMGLVACCVVLALVISIPLGGVLAKTALWLPLVVGGVMGLVSGVFALFAFPKAWDVERSSHSLRSLLTDHPALRAPVLIVGLERFGVGAFVVTLQVWAHDVLALPKETVSHWFSAFLVTFAIATWPFARLGDRLPRPVIVGVGAVAYALMFALLGVVEPARLGLVLAVGGLGAAAIYGPALGLVTAAVPSEARSSAMGLLNAIGTLGMFIGNVGAGALTEGLRSLGVEPSRLYPLVFLIAGGSQLISVVLVSLRVRTTDARPANS